MKITTTKFCKTNIMKTTMKLLVLFMCLSMSAQISTPVPVNDGVTIGRARKNGVVPVLKRYDNNRHMLFYDSLRYSYLTDVKAISFIADKEELDILYNFFLDGFKSRKASTLRVGDQTVDVKKVASSIRITVYYKYETSGWFYLSKKQLNRLFGKI